MMNKNEKAAEFYKHLEKCFSDIKDEGVSTEQVMRKARRKILDNNGERIKEDFISLFNLIQFDCHDTAVSKGWWKKERNDGELIALMHSELSEALEALRHGNPPDDKVPEFSGIEAELADVIIRIMDYAESRNMNVVEAMLAKMEMNKGRKHKHGGKKF